MSELQAQVEDLDQAKIAHYAEVLEGETDVWELILSKVSLVCRSEIELWEKVAGKASDIGLESVSQHCFPSGSLLPLDPF